MRARAPSTRREPEAVRAGAAGAAADAVRLVEELLELRARLQGRPCLRQEEDRHEGEHEQDQDGGRQGPAGEELVSGGSAAGAAQAGRLRCRLVGG